MAWFMQHGAPPHTAHDNTITYLKELFVLAPLPIDHEWVPYSSDPNPLDFFCGQVGHVLPLLLRLCEVIPIILVTA